MPTLGLPRAAALYRWVAHSIGTSITKPWREIVNTNMTDTCNPPISTWPDRTNLVLGALLCVSPWLAGGGSIAITWNAVAFGAAIAITAIAAIARPAVGPEWTNVGLGAWLVIAPWVFGFSDQAVAGWTSLLVGILVAYFAGIQITLMKRSAASRRSFPAQ
ncbi:MAG TPA: SPW repeat protein [Rhodanobacteraceae bacterium]|nr:SPW repeat protein [Rhodanobacteraceae bacterium]